MFKLVGTSYLKDHLWNSSNEVVIGREENEMFKIFGWERGLSELVHISSLIASNTLAHGVQPAWDVSLYCSSKSINCCVRQLALILCWHSSLYPSR